MNFTPVRSGNSLIDGVFDICVKLLLWLADLFGVSYNTINIWIFCVIWPILTLALIATVIRQQVKIRRLMQLKGSQTTGNKPRPPGNDRR